MQHDLPPLLPPPASHLALHSSCCLSPLIALASLYFLPACTLASTRLPGLPQNWQAQTLTARSQADLTTPSALHHLTLHALPASL